MSITQNMIYASASALSTSLTDEEVAANWLYPDVNRIRDVSVIVARGVIKAAKEDGVDRELALRNLQDAELDAYIRERMYDPFQEGESVMEEIREITRELGGVGIGAAGEGGAATNTGASSAAAAGPFASPPSSSSPAAVGIVGDGGAAAARRPADLLTRLSTGPSTGREAHGEAMTVQWSRGQ